MTSVDDAADAFVTTARRAECAVAVVAARHRWDLEGAAARLAGFPDDRAKATEFVLPVDETPPPTTAPRAGHRAAAGPTEYGDDPRGRSPARRHGHLWVLVDGTPAHAPPGRLTVDADGRIACHLCGRWFEHLGLHLRRHGWDTERYRSAVGLGRHRPLCSSRMSARIAARQKRRWDADPALRQHFSRGQQAARSGELGALAAHVVRLRRAAGDEPAEVTRVTKQSLDRGRRSVDRHRREQRDLVVAGSGHASLHEYLRAEYAAGASLETLAATLGLGRVRLREQMDAAGVVRRPSGVNRADSKRARAAVNEAVAAARVGVEDVRVWLREQRARGVTVPHLARLVGHSEPWVRARIAS